MSTDTTFNPSTLQWVEIAASETDDDVQGLTAIELADLCDQLFQELDSENPEFGTLTRYQELEEEIERRRLAQHQLIHA